MNKFKTNEFGRRIPILEITDDTEDLLSQNTTDLEKKEVTSEEEASYLMRQLAEMEIPWHHLDGCYCRAEISCRLLKLMEIPNEKIKKIWVKGSINFQNSFNKTMSWQWHIAPLIITPSGKKFVLDPSVNSINALSPSQWIARLARGQTNIQYGEIESNSTSDFLSGNKKILVTDSIFENYKKAMLTHNFTSACPEDSLVSKRLQLEHSLPLTDSPPGIDLEPFEGPFTLLDSEKIKGSSACTIM